MIFHVQAHSHASQATCIRLEYTNIICSSVILATVEVAVRQVLRQRCIHDAFPRVI